MAVTLMGAGERGSFGGKVDGLWIPAALTGVAHLIASDHYVQSVTTGSFRAVCGSQLHPSSMLEAERSRCRSCQLVETGGPTRAHRASRRPRRRGEL